MAREEDASLALAVLALLQHVLCSAWQDAGTRGWARGILDGGLALEDIVELVRVLDRERV